MGDITLEDIKSLLDNKLGLLKKDIENSIDELKKELKKDIENSNDELKKDIENSNDELKKELKNTNYRVEMIQSYGGKVNTFLDALSPAAAVGSKYYKTNSYYSE